VRGETGVKTTREIVTFKEENSQRGWNQGKQSEASESPLDRESDSRVKEEKGRGSLEEMEWQAISSNLCKGRGRARKAVQSIVFYLKGVGSWGTIRRGGRWNGKKEKKGELIAGGGGDSKRGKLIPGSKRTKRVAKQRSLQGGRTWNFLDEVFSKLPEEKGESPYTETP